MQPDRSGQHIGHYRVVRLLGRGGSAEVYLGEHIHLNTQAAIKMLNTRITANDRERFRSEARLIAHMEHPNIVRVLDFGFDEHFSPYLVMSYAPGGSLREHFPRSTPLSLQTIIPYVNRIAAALHYAHSTHKLIHCDVKPENMLLASNGEVLLSDFGISVLAQTTTKQEVAGTAPYMAPEQIRGTPHFASDQYALGIVVYEWLTGKRPFNGSYTQICSQHLLLPPPPLHIYVPIAPAVEQVVLTALRKEPQLRFASISAFAHALEQVSSQVHSSALPYSTRLANMSSVCLQCGTLLPPGGQYCSSCGFHNVPIADPSPSHLPQQLAAQSPLTGNADPGALYSGTPASLVAGVPAGFLNPLQTPLNSSSVPQHPPMGTNTSPHALPLTPNQTSRPDPASHKRTIRRLLAALIITLLTLVLGSAGLFYLTSKQPPTSCVTTSQHPLFSDCFLDNQHNWDATSSDPQQYSITIGNGTLTLENHMPQVLAERVPNKEDFADFTLTVDAILARGTANDSYGIYFRGHFDQTKGIVDSYYRFELYGDGSYALFKGAPGKPDTILIQRTTNGAIQKSGQSNHIAINAHGPSLAFSINNTRLTTMTDSTYTSGTIALFGANLSKSPDGIQAIFKQLLIVG